MLRASLVPLLRARRRPSRFACGRVLQRPKRRGQARRRAATAPHDGRRRRRRSSTRAHRQRRVRARRRRTPAASGVELDFPDGQTHDFVVLDAAGSEVWRWSDGRMFTQAHAEQVLLERRHGGLRRALAARRAGTLHARSRRCAARTIRRAAGGLHAAVDAVRGATARGSTVPASALPNAASRASVSRRPLDIRRSAPQY